MFKKWLGLFLFFSLILVTPVRAGEVDVTFKRLKTSTGTAITDLALTSGVAVYSEPYLVSDSGGYTTILITEDKSGGAGDVDVSAEYSIDGVNFYTPYSTSSGTLTADSNIVTTLQNATRWIYFTARMGKWVRIKLDPDANSEVTLDILYYRVH